jgi:hypothetical protein
MSMFSFFCPFSMPLMFVFSMALVFSMLARSMGERSTIRHPRSKFIKHIHKALESGNIGRIMVVMVTGSLANAPSKYKALIGVFIYISFIRVRIVRVKFW